MRSENISSLFSCKRSTLDSGGDERQRSWHKMVRNEVGTGGRGNFTRAPFRRRRRSLSLIFGLTTALALRPPLSLFPTIRAPLQFITSVQNIA